MRHGMVREIAKDATTVTTLAAQQNNCTQNNIRI
jgi:hypothetical protein